MTLYYPCGIDVHGESPRDGARSRMHNLAPIPEVEPVVISASYLMRARETRLVIVDPKRMTKVGLIYAIGPCSLLRVEMASVLSLDGDDEELRRWCRINRIVVPGQQLRCTIRCRPSFFMLDQPEDTIEEPP